MDDSGLFNLQKSPQGVCLACTCGEKQRQDQNTTHRGEEEIKQIQRVQFILWKTCYNQSSSWHPLMSFLLTPHRHQAPKQANVEDFNINAIFRFPVNSTIWELTFSVFFPPWTRKSTNTTRGKRVALSSSLAPSSQIDGPCNWQPLCAIARINRHWCRQAESVSGAQRAADMVELMVHHIYGQNTINVSAERSGRLYVARRATVLLILRMLLSDGVSMFDVWCSKLRVILTNGIFFFAFSLEKGCLSTRLFVDEKRQKKYFSCRKKKLYEITDRQNSRNP